MLQDVIKRKLRGQLPDRVLRGNVPKRGPAARSGDGIGSDWRVSIRAACGALWIDRPTDHNKSRRIPLPDSQNAVSTRGAAFILYRNVKCGKDVAESLERVCSQNFYPKTIRVELIGASPLVPETNGGGSEITSCDIDLWPIPGGLFWTSAGPILTYAAHGLPCNGQTH